MRQASIVLIFMTLLVWPAWTSGNEPDFSATWHDGRAELNGYLWTGDRYGETRTGQAVMVFVTEPFSESRRVKVDDPGKHPDDTVDVLKLNMVRDFQTGVYDYNTMVSVFVRTGDFSPLKTSFTSAEWCGHVYNEQLFNTDGIHERYFSYFEGETGERTLPWNRGGVTEDELFIRLRGLRGAFLEPGESVELPFLPGVFRRRLAHQGPAWGTITITRTPKTKEFEVPAGRFETMGYVLETSDGRSGRFDIDVAYPHPVVRWSWTGAGVESGELTGTTRLKYWELHGNGDESHLEAVGLRPLPR